MAELPLSFEQGVDESQENSLLPDGAASLLENYIPEPNGGLRCRRMWSNTSTASAPATRRARGIGFFSLDNQGGDVDVKVGSFAARTSIGSTAVTGVGFTPKALILFTSGKPTVAGFANGFAVGMGFVSSVTDAYSVSASSENGVADSNSARRMANKALTVVNPDQTVDGEYGFTSFDADGFTLDCTDGFGAAILINYIAIGGNDVTNAKVVKWDSGTATGTKAVTGVGFEPSLVLHANSLDSTTTVPTTQAAALFSFGAMDSSGNQWVNGFQSNDATAASDTQRAQVTDGTILRVSSTLSLTDKATYSSMDADGFTVNWTTKGAYQMPIVSLCLKMSSSGRAKAGSFNKDTGAAPDPQSVTGVGFTPTGVLLSSWGRASSASAQANTVWSMGAVSGVGSEKSIAIRDEDAQATMDVESYQNVFPLSLVNTSTPSTLDAQLDFTSFDSDGFTGSWTTNDGEADQILYLALGGVASAGVDKVLVAQNDASTNFDIYALNTSQLSSGTWEVIASDLAVTDPLSMLTFASGLGQTLYTHKKFTLARRYDGTTDTSIAGSPPGRTIAFHKNRFFIGGTEANPTRLWYSDLAAYSTWGATSYIDVGRDDGEAIEDIAVFENGLLIAKRNSLWFLSGSSPDEFSVQPLNAGGGQAGRSITPTPFGAVVAGARHVWLWAGGGVENISKPIEDSYDVTDADFVSTGYIDGETYVCDENSGTLYVVDMQRGAWRMEKLASPLTEGPAVIAVKSDKLYYGPQNATTMSLLAYKEMPGSARGRDSGLGITYKAWTPELWPENPGDAFTPRRLLVKYRQRGGTTGQAGITITPIYDGVVSTAVSIAAQSAAGTYRKAIGIGSKKGIYSAMFQFEQTLTTSDASAIDLEEIVLDYEGKLRRRNG